MPLFDVEGKDPTQTVLIQHKKFTAAYQAMKECYESYGQVAQPVCKLITGPSGAGKSRVRKYFRDQYPKEGDDLPVLCVTVPPEVTLRSFAEEVLTVLQDPYPSRGSAADLGRRIDIALGRQEGGHRVRVFVIDECQRFTDSRWTVLYDCANFLRERIEKSQSSLVLLGLEYGSALVECNEQLQRLFDETITIAPFNWSEKDERTEFRGILKALQASLAESYKFPVDLAEIDLSFRLHYASFGLVGYLMTLVRGAASLARKRGTKEITKDLLAEAYRKHVRGKDTKNPDPFYTANFTPVTAPAQELPRDRATEHRRATHKRRTRAPRLSARTSEGM
jgi:hypothetical protein